MISLLSLPFLTRLFEPVAYAQWAVVQAIVLFIGAVASLRYDLAIVVERDDAMASALFWLATLSGSSIALVTATVLIGFNVTEIFSQDWIADGQTLLIALSWILAAAISPALMGWCLRTGRFAVISATQISIAATTLVIQAAGGLWSADSASWKWLLVGSTIGQVAGLAVLSAQFIGRDNRPEALASARRNIVGAGRHHFKFVKYSLPFTIFGAMRDRLPLFVVGAWTSSRDLGLYSQAWRLSSVPAGLTGAVIRPVLFHTSAAEGLASLETALNRILLLLIVTGVPLLAIVMGFPSEILGWLLGDRWSEIGPIIAPLLVPAFVFSISNWMDRLLDSTGRQDLNLITEIISGVTSVGALLATLALGLGLHTAVAAQSAVLTLNYLAFIYLVYSVAGYRRATLGLLLLSAITLFGITFFAARKIFG
ncbi:oligosaccharide flippase family protein [Pseudorhizobium pelagicum]|nr:oligosaccharide flippase family protein [Pseudorhizobium pelagicum]